MLNRRPRPRIREVPENETSRSVEFQCPMETMSKLVTLRRGLIFRPMLTTCLPWREPGSNWISRPPSKFSGKGGASAPRHRQALLALTIRRSCFGYSRQPATQRQSPVLETCKVMVFIRDLIRVRYHLRPIGCFHFVTLCRPPTRSPSTRCRLTQRTLELSMPITFCWRPYRSLQLMLCLRSVGFWSWQQGRENEFTRAVIRRRGKVIVASRALCAARVPPSCHRFLDRKAVLGTGPRPRDGPLKFSRYQGSDSASPPSN